MKRLLTLSVFLISLSLAHAKQSASFESSDGNWGDNEVLAKGRDFKSILFYFESYKFKCGVEDVFLVRTTKPGLFANKKNPKWKVPYKDPSPHIAGGYYPRISNKDHCFNKPYRPGEVEEIKKRAESQWIYWNNLDSKEKE